MAVPAICRAIPRASGDARVFSIRSCRERMAADVEQDEPRKSCCHRPSRPKVCLGVVLFVAAPVVYMIATGSFEWPNALIVPAVWAGCSGYLVLVARNEARKDRLMCQADHIYSLASSLSDKAGRAALADIDEIRLRSADAHGLAGRYGPDGLQFANTVRLLVEKIDQAYDAKTGSVMLARVEIGSLASKVQRLGMKIAGEDEGWF